MPRAAWRNPVRRLEFVLPEDHLQLERHARGRVQPAWLQSDGHESAVRSVPIGRHGDCVTPGTGLFVNPEPVEDEFTRFSLRAGKEWYSAQVSKAACERRLSQRFRPGPFQPLRIQLLRERQAERVFRKRGSFRRSSGRTRRLHLQRVRAVPPRRRAGSRSCRAARRRSANGRTTRAIGLSANFVGPWTTVININYGYALQSDIPDLEGEQEFLLFVFKLF